MCNFFIFVDKGNQFDDLGDRIDNDGNRYGTRKIPRFENILKSFFTLAEELKFLFAFGGFNIKILAPLFIADGD